MIEIKNEHGEPCGHLDDDDPIAVPIIVAAGIVAAIGVTEPSVKQYAAELEIQLGVALRELARHRARSSADAELHRAEVIKLQTSVLRLREIALKNSKLLSEMSRPSQLDQRKRENDAVRPRLAPKARLVDETDPAFPQTLTGGRT